MAAKKKPPKIKPRNPVLVPSLGRKAGKHGPDPKGVRRASNRAAQDEALKTLVKGGRDSD